MPDTQQLPSLLRLFDDPSETIRRTVLGELAAWGDGLETALIALESPPSAQTIAAVIAAVAAQNGALAEPVLSATEAQPTTAEAFEALVDGDADPVMPLTVGQLVRHVRYGYRGVIVAIDERCQAPKAWYLANRTRPRRDQQWYHVLVHDSSSVTYAAQSSLAGDTSEDAVKHPLLPMFFDDMRDGSYQRNNTPWPPA